MQDYFKIGTAFFRLLNENDKVRLGRAMQGVPPNCTREDEERISRALPYLERSAWDGPTPSADSLREMCGTLVDAWAEVDENTTVEVERAAYLSAWFGAERVERLTALAIIATESVDNPRWTPRQIGDRVFDQMSDEERKHLAAAMKAAAESGWGDGSDSFYCNLANAGTCVTVGPDDKVTETAMREMLAVLEDARRSYLSDYIDWVCLCADAFGYRNRGRFVELYACAAEVGCRLAEPNTPGGVVDLFEWRALREASIGNALFNLLTERDRIHLARSMIRMAQSSEGTQQDDLYCALANLVDMPRWNGGPVVAEDLKDMCVLLVRAWHSPRAQSLELERVRILRGAFGHASEDRLTAMAIAAENSPAGSRRAPLRTPAEIGVRVYSRMTDAERTHFAEQSAKSVASLSKMFSVSAKLEPDVLPITEEHLCSVLGNCASSLRQHDIDQEGWFRILDSMHGQGNGQRFVELYDWATDGD